MKEDDFKKMMLENMRPGKHMQTTIPQREELLSAIHNLELMVVGQADRLFCNSFLSESIQLLANSVFLYEDGYFDCAFYSVRQAAETCNNMLFIANKGESELVKWNQKGYFPMNQKILQQLSAIDTFYSDVRNAIPDFFRRHEDFIKKIHKVVHKQGFDSFYAPRRSGAYGVVFQRENELEYFIECLNLTICMMIVVYIVVDPISLVLADEDLTMRFAFAPLSEPADVEFLQAHAGYDIVAKIKATPYFSEFSHFFKEKERMLPATFDVIRNQFFNQDNLDDIKSQKDLLNFNESIILELLLAGIEITRIHPDCFILGYDTSISSNYQPMERSSTDYDQYLNHPESFNIKHNIIFRSIVKGPNKNWLIEHNQPFSEKEIRTIQGIFEKYNILYLALQTAIDDMQI